MGLFSENMHTVIHFELGEDEKMYAKQTEVYFKKLYVFYLN